MARLPNSLSFRLVVTIDVDDVRHIPVGFSGRVQVHGTAGVTEIRWVHHGSLDDPAPGVAAVTRLRPDGSVKQVRHYRHGRLHDPATGEAAVRGFYASGAPRYAEHYRYGWRQDCGDVPAIRKWRADGSLRSRRHFRDNRPVARR